MALTLRQARVEGYRIVRGAYIGTTDDRADRWYVDFNGSDVIDHRGKGFATRADALRAIEEKLDTDAYWAAVEAAYERREAGE